MKKISHFIGLLWVCMTMQAQQQRIFSEDIRSLQVLIDDDPLRAPVMEKGEHVVIEFDELSHDYHRYIYHILHCNADWTETEDLFESDFLTGFNDQPIEDYENSLNTTQLYTHYRLVFPNKETQLRVSGNYRVLIYEDEDRDEPLLQAEFCLAESTMNIIAELTTNTDIDFNQAHQQLSYSISYGANRVVDPMREIHTVVMQNRRQDTKVIDLPPNIQKSNGVEFTHRRELIFPAGNEFHKFEILDVQKPGLKVDNMRWYEPYYHATLYTDKPPRNYILEEDQNGAFVMRNDGDIGEDATTSEYLWVHFSLRMPKSDTPIRLYGQWTNGFPDEQYLMEYNEEAQEYQAAVYVKQGYYNYMYLGENGEAPDGNFYETENEYMILVYYRPQGGRYDRLAGYRVMRSA